MFGRFLRWAEERTGAGALMRAVLEEDIPGGARWAYVFGSALVITLSVQILTGIGLMLTYSPGATTAWGSVYWIEHRVTLGWLIRGMHHYGAQAMVIVLGFHLIQVSVYGAYKAPREFNWWIGLGLLGLTLAFALTGYLLPWDQKGYWATRVATNIMGTLPLVGEQVQQLAVGGAEYGNATLTRFYTLHVVVLPLALLALLAAHLYLFRRHGVTPPVRADLKVVGKFNPDQLLRDLAAGFVVLFAVMLLAIRSHGAELDAPADPSSDYPARPEWYFLFLFQLLKFFEGPLEVVGTVVLPGLAFAFLFALPLLDNKPDRSLRARLPWMVALTLGGLSIAGLTGAALSQDANDPKFQAAVGVARQRADRAATLASKGIGPEGAGELLRRDPETAGPALFGEHCAQCHKLAGKGGKKASDLKFFASRHWTYELTKNPQHPNFFGRTKHHGMESQLELGESTLYAVAVFLEAEGAAPGEARDMTRLPAGERAFRESCMACHLYKGEGRSAGLEDGPDLTGYGSEAWIRGQILEPQDPTRYGTSHQMPSFADKLDPWEVDILVTLLRRERMAGVSQQ
jgi:ubiquinol-cytochrome c reductase cytochrome b subunit